MAEAVEIRVPDIGDFSDVEVIDVLVAPGQEVKPEDPLITLESDKATMDVPAPMAGRVVEVLVKTGDRVSEGSPILMLEPAGEQPAGAGGEPQPSAAGGGEPPPAAATGPGPQPAGEAPAAATPAPAPAAAPAQPPAAAPPQAPAAAPPAAGEAGPPPLASPSVRRLARELGVDLRQVTGSGPRGRILADDVKAYVKKALTSGAPAAAGPGLPTVPEIDFSRFGPVEEQPVGRIKRLSAQNLHRAWLVAPHVTQFDEADITELEAFRKAQRETAEKAGTRLTLLAFLIKAAVAALKRFPTFNASLSPDGERLILKRYYHIGFAADTPRGLLVPVLRDADAKGVLEIAGELQALAAKAREGKLGPAEMQGASFTISSLGGIGGTAFTPIINVPEVAILGVSRSAMRPVWRDGEFVPRLMLPLSLSYDHRVIDGAEAARFTSYLAGVLGDIRQLLL